MPELNLDELSDSLWKKLDPKITERLQKLAMDSLVARGPGFELPEEERKTLPGRIKSLLNYGLYETGLYDRARKIDPATGRIRMVGRVDDETRNFRDISDAVLIVSTIRGKAIRDLGPIHDLFLIARNNYVQKLMGYTAALGLEWYPEELSAQLVSDVFAEGGTGEIHPVFPIGTTVSKIPKAIGRISFHKWISGTTMPVSDQATGDIDYSMETMYAQVAFNRDLEEDALFAVANVFRAALSRDAGGTITDVTINGQKTAGIDSDLPAAATAKLKLWNGYRYLVNGNAQNVDFSNAFAGVATKNKVIDMLAALAKYGIIKSDVILFCSVKTAYKWSKLNDTNDPRAFIPAEDVASQARLQHSQAWGIFQGVTVVPTEFIREDLNASGVYDAVTTDRTVLIAVHKGRLAYGRRRQMEIDQDREIKDLRNILVASERLDFQPFDTMTANPSPVVIGYNLPG